VTAQNVVGAQIHWSRLAGLRDTARSRVDARLQRLAAGHRDLLDIHIADRDMPRAGHEIRITCNARGHAITVRQEHARVGVALHGALEDFEREVHRLRDRRQVRRRAPADRPELEPPDLEV
jgi:ribosome-associated translation inhibitor RaiA